jgi:hypothetical protein
VVEYLRVFDHVGFFFRLRRCVVRPTTADVATKTSD